MHPRLDQQTCHVRVNLLNVSHIVNVVVVKAEEDSPVDREPIVEISPHGNENKPQAMPDKCGEVACASSLARRL